MRSLSKREQYHNINNCFWKRLLFCPSLVLMSFKERLVDSLRNSITPYLKAVVPRLSRRFDVNREFWAPSVGSKVEINAPVFYNCLLFLLRNFLTNHTQRRKRNNSQYSIGQSFPWNFIFQIFSFHCAKCYATMQFWNKFIMEKVKLDRPW